MDLSAAEAGALIKAMKTAFDSGSLKVLLAERGGAVIYDHVTSPLHPVPVQVADIVVAFQQRFETEVLVAAVRDARPRVSEFSRLNDLLRLTETPSVDQFQVVVRDQTNPFTDVETFRATLAEREGQVCRVEVQADGTERFGTGVLIGPNLVLTNHHVVADALSDIGQIACRFDFRVSADGKPVHAGKVFKTTGIAHSSAPSEGDHTGVDPGQQEDRLDYALLQLDDDISAIPRVDGGAARGVTPLRSRAAITKPDIGIVLQHPDGRPLKIAMGAVTGRIVGRALHDISTDKGSSGSPLLDSALDLAALHQAGVDWPDVQTAENRAIPIDLILAHARAAGVAV